MSDEGSMKGREEGRGALANAIAEVLRALMSPPLLIMFDLEVYCPDFSSVMLKGLN